MLRVQVGLGAAWTREFAIGIFDGDGIAFRGAIEAVLHDGRTSWRTW